MNLSVLIGRLPVKKVFGNTQVDISAIECDSRNVKEGALFVAIKGVVADGHDYIEAAIAKGASAIVCEQQPASINTSAVMIEVADSSDALGLLLDQWYQHPSESLTLVGVTGTNGKTTIATLLYDLFRILGHKVGLISTVCNYINDEAIPTDHTTPDAITLHRLLARMVSAGCEYAFMEVSSHAVDQKRISGLSFRGGIFTNLSRDHLDYHQTVANYLKAKKTFFDSLPGTAFALTNADDKSGLVMLQNTAARKLTYSLRQMADFKGKILETHFDGTEMQINGRDIFVHFVGRFNASNLLAVYGTASTLGKDAEEILIALSTLRSVSGRFETISSSSGYTAIVDYAHTPDALTNVLKGIQDVQNGNGRIITVVGAGGNRDKGKRPLMAKEAVKMSDLVILTSDNPRFEEPDVIIQDMAAGLTKDDLDRTLCITDRAQAIKTAMQLARKGDVVLVAGKGHENYQEIKGIKHHFDDREVIKTIFESQQ
ncbi:MAG: UDP-N-acetylmuramoyl-L-alanyl-D-glutamate--2,6-diaminopimelate ligase [Tannerella sp.]|jgi:UDP-N-acetylmuramoyl-L-alanyl-D-glutamate--2,6-diaminopimelate ligase|nr:UDP-N-acetylmuramoyl-L-alanyl-D-glutamate--2,6-diaminopimelate ligase [Tannerella sp.]